MGCGFFDTPTQVMGCGFFHTPPHATTRQGAGPHFEAVRRPPTVTFFEAKSTPALGWGCHPGEHAKKMNSMVGFLFDVLPYEEFKKRVRQQPELKHVEIGDARLLYCVTGKALVTLGIWPHEDSTTDMSLEDVRTYLTSMESRMLIKIFQKVEPLESSVLTDAPSTRFQECQNLDDHLPSSLARTVGKKTWDVEPHHCKGSEHLAVRAAGQLREHGWLKSVVEG